MSTGNDIVSLSAVNIPRTKQFKFYSKILSASEQALYNEAGISAIPFESYVWLLWSVKEAAYKYLKRIDPALIFSPTKFIVTKLQLPSGYKPAKFAQTETEGNNFDPGCTINGILNYREEIVYYRSLIYRELITSVINGNDDFKNIWWGIKSIDDPENQSAKVREFMLSKLAQVTGITAIEVEKDPAGIPVLLKGGKESEIPVSFSHHGQFIAYSFSLL